MKTAQQIKKDKVLKYVLMQQGNTVTLRVIDQLDRNLNFQPLKGMLVTPTGVGLYLDCVGIRGTYRHMDNYIGAKHFEFLIQAKKYRSKVKRALESYIQFVIKERGL